MSSKAFPPSSEPAPPPIKDPIEPQENPDVQWPEPDPEEPGQI